MANHINIVIFLVLCTAWQTYGQAVDCTQTGVGRFPDPTDTTCQNYTYCVLNTATNTYTSYNYVCPTTSVFNPGTSQCTAPANYNCAVTATTTVAPDSCTEDGYVADPSSTDCSSYIQCVQINGTFDETTYTCPNGTYYNPNTTFCEDTYVCSALTTVTTTQTPTTAATFTCTAVGRFANTSDTTCQSYYYCVSTGTGTYTQYQYTCPTTSVFNPSTSQCTAPANYTCPTS